MFGLDRLRFRALERRLEAVEDDRDELRALLKRTAGRLDKRLADLQRDLNNAFSEPDVDEEDDEEEERLLNRRT